MNFNKYKEIINERLKYNFNLTDDRIYNGIEFDIVAKSQIRNEKYFATKKTVIYAFENHEYCYIKHFEKLNNEIIENITNMFKQTINTELKPTDEHMSTVFTLVFVANNTVDDLISKKIKKFKYQKTFSFGFKGWAVLRVLVIDLSQNKVICSKEAKKIEKSYRPSNKKVC